MASPAVRSEPILTGVRKTLLQQQSEVTVKDPATHANRQVRELDKFAGGMAAKKKACLDQIDKDRKELAHVNTQLSNEGRKYRNLLENLRLRRAERDRVRAHLDRCSCDNALLMKDACARTRWMRREDGRMLKSVSSTELEAARGFGSGPGTTFSRKRSRLASPSGSGQTLPPLGGRGGGSSGGMSHSISAPALRR